MKLITFIFLFFAIVPLVMKCSFNFGNFVLLVLSLCFYLLSIEIPMWLEVMIIIGLVLFFIVVVHISYKMLSVLSKKPEKNETVILLGCGVYGTRPSLALIERMETAMSYMKHNDSICIVSGGQGRLEDISEAEVMYAYMTKHGIQASRIKQENKSRSTEENILFSKRIMEENHLNNKAVIVTQSYHMYRASLICEKYGLEFYGLSAKSKWYALPIYWIREVCAITYLTYLKKSTK